MQLECNHCIPSLLISTCNFSLTREARKKLLMVAERLIKMRSCISNQIP